MDTSSVLARPIDVSLPGLAPLDGGLHPTIQMMYDLNDAFAALNFDVFEGPELEDDWHNFEALNMPADHPARDMQDTPIWRRGAPCARCGAASAADRTHPVRSIRYMESASAALPVHRVSGPRVSQRDNFDATTRAVFTQVEGLVVDKGICLGVPDSCCFARFADRVRSPGADTVARKLLSVRRTRRRDRHVSA